jgi:hypothetical protein
MLITILSHPFYKQLFAEVSRGAAFKSNRVEMVEGLCLIGMMKGKSRRNLFVVSFKRHELVAVAKSAGLSSMILVESYDMVKIL